jgi:hypothetical protein
MAAGSRSERIQTRRIGVGGKDKMRSSAAMSLHDIFRDDSLTNDQGLEISVVNAHGREIRREFVHRH